MLPAAAGPCSRAADHPQTGAGDCPSAAPCPSCGLGGLALRHLALRSAHFGKVDNWWRVRCFDPMACPPLRPMDRTGRYQFADRILIPSEKDTLFERLRTDRRQLS